MDLAARFADVVGRPEPPLDEGAFLVAAARGATIDVDAQVGRLDDLARGCPEASLDGLRAYLFEELGFRGNRDEYGDPANSYLDAVLDRRLGIPITLAVVTIEVGRRAGVPLGGVGMPGHFLVRSLAEPGLYVDAFDGGRFLGDSDCRALYERLHPQGRFEPEFLDVVGNRAILWRMLNNLRHAFAVGGDLGSLRWVLDLQLAFPDVDAGERRVVAAMLGSVGHLDRAADKLDEVAADLDDEAAERARTQARVLRARLN